MMAVDTTDLKTIFSMFATELEQVVANIQTETNMEDEYFAQVVSQGIVGAMDSSVRTLDVLKRNELVDEQIDTEKKRRASVEHDIKIKAQQELSEKIKNGVVAIEYTYDTETETGLTTQDYSVANADGNTITGASYETATDGTKSIYEIQKDTESEKTDLVKNDAKLKKQQTYTVVAKRKREQGATVDDTGNISYTTDKSSHIEKQIELLGEQIDKVEADRKYVKAQKTNMDKQVRHNAIIQAMDKAEGYNMGIGSAGLIPDQAMHTNFFIQNKALMLEAGVEFDDAGNATLVREEVDSEGNVTRTTESLGKFDIAASASESSS